MFYAYLVGRNEHDDQELAQAMVFILSLLMMLTLINSIVFRLMGIIIFTFYSCFVHNVMVTFDEKSLMLFILNIMIAGMACDSAITSFMQEDAPRPRKTEKKIV